MKGTGVPVIEPIRLKSLRAAKNSLLLSENLPTNPTKKQSDASRTCVRQAAERRESQ